MSTPEGEPRDVTDAIMSNPIYVDIANIKMGWLKLTGGRDWIEWVDNDPSKTPKPIDAHKQGFSLYLCIARRFL